MSSQPQFQRILIARMSAMGDIIHSLPAVAALRQAFPTACIGWAIEERWADLLSTPSARNHPTLSTARPLVDKIHIVDTRTWRSSPFTASTRRQIRDVIQEVRAAKYELAIDLQAAVRSALLCWLSRTPQRVGFAEPREAAAKLFYTRSIKISGSHVVEQGIELARSVSGRNDLQVEFPLPTDPAAEDWCVSELRRKGIRDFAIMNPGSGWGAKCWPLERYAELAKCLGKEGIATIVNFGPGEEKLAQTLQENSAGTAQAVASSLAQLTSLVRRARIFVGGDTGPVHLAAALGVAVVAIYGPTNPARNGPFGPSGPCNGHIKVLRSPESQTSHTRRSVPESGLLQITVENVVRATHQILGIPA